MSRTAFKRQSLRQLGTMTSLLMISMLISQISCGGSATNPGQQNISNTSANSQATPPAANVNTSSEEAAKAMNKDPLEDNLVLVMKDWSGLELAKLERNSTLSSMWILRHSSSRPYDPQGITHLIKRIRANDFFKNTPRIKDQTNKLTRGFFVVGGGIQTQGQLYDFLAL
jgi:hypothetical protein